MNGIRLFDFGDLNVRVGAGESGDPWFVLSDVCKALDIDRTHDVARRIPDYEKGTRSIRTPGGTQRLTVVTEPGLYRVIFRSNKSEAKRFQRWVFHDVLPQIRETGGYGVEHHSLPDTNEPPLVERETRHPDGRVIVERFAPPAEYERPTLLDLDPPEPDITPDVPVEMLRKRFHGAFMTAIQKLPEFERIPCAIRRGQFCRKMNSDLKRFIGRRRGDWSALDYHNAVYWLRMQYGVDIQWILQPQAPTHH